MGGGGGGGGSNEPEYPEKKPDSQSGLMGLSRNY